MRVVDWVDERGRKYRSLLPDDAPEAEAPMGILVGPPEDITDVLDLPEPFATRLHNELFARGLFDYGAAVRNGQGVMGALQAALRLDATTLVAAFANAAQADEPAHQLNGHQRPPRR